MAIRTAAILGGGPAGAALAAHLGRAGIDTLLFHRGKRPPIIVGESLVPAIVPHLRDLGVEEEVASYSIYKRGATFILNAEEDLNVLFADVRGAKTPYAYNSPRDRLDASILGAARKHAAVVEASARLVRGEDDRVLLDAATLEAAGDALGGRQPDFIIDATGRSRALGALMKVATLDGPRRDTALHAHLEGVEVEVESNIHTDRLEHGWCWRIPLPGRVSIGLVIDSELIAKFGSTPEEQLDHYLSVDSHIRDWARPARRVTPVVRYTNYQRISERATGANWALVGDSYGFVDPVFSSGLLIALNSARELADALIDGSAASLARYERFVERNVRAWQSVIDHFYDGRLLTLLHFGDSFRTTWIGRLLDFHFRKVMPRIFTGEDATNRYSLGLLRFMCRYGLALRDPEKLRIH